MKRIMSLVLAAVMLIGCMSVLSACGEPKNDGAEIRVYLGEEIYDFDPTEYIVDDNAEQVMSLLFEPLFTLNKRGKLEKDGAAKKYKVDKEERTIVIELRESYWSDEIRLTAKDYVYAWTELLLEPTNANPAAALLYDIENAVDVKNGDKTIYDIGVKASNTYEITITYREGADYKQLLKNLANVATSPVRQDICTEFSADYWTKLLNSAVTNGPFSLENIDYVTGEFKLARNRGYHQKSSVKDYTKIVNPNKLVSFTDADGSEFNVSYSDIAEKTVFFATDAPLADRAANKDNAKVRDDLSTYTYVFNTEHPALAKAEVRRALSMAIDRNAIVNAVTFGKAATGLIPDAIKGFRESNVISTSAKLDDAKAIVDGAGLSAQDKAITLTVNDDEQSVTIANLVKEAWEYIGFTVTVNAVGAKTSKITDFTNNEKIDITDSEIQYIVKAASRGERNFDVIAVDWQMFCDDAFVALAAFSVKYSGCGKHFSDDGNVAFGSFGGYSNADYDALIDKAFNSTDKDERLNALRDAERLLIETGAIAPIMYNQTFYFANKDISKVSFNGFGNLFLNDMKQKHYEDYIDN